MSTTEIEKRLTALEREIAQLKGKPKTHPIHVLEQIHGTFENDEAFKEAARLGRKWRDSQLSNTRKPRAKRK
jgi:hypothetical protein